MSLAVVFPGQGSQSVGMQNDLAEAFPVIQETYAEASAVLGFDLWQLITVGSEEELKQTAITQPALLTAGVAAWRAWLSQGGPKPELMAGHSLGEYSALVCAGVIEFSTAVMVVRKRGEFMQSAVPAGEGAMAAILNLDSASIAGLCEQVDQLGVVQIANYNSPVQTVIAGTSAAVERVGQLAIEAGAKRVVPLPVSAPFHCELMAPAAQEMAKLLADVTFNSPQIAVLNNVDVATESDPEAIKGALVRQITGSVRWVELVEKMVTRKIHVVVECGPGKVLAGLGRRISRDLENRVLVDQSSLRDAAAELN
ncbi:MAG: [acyl-carrier-protein] S-malonyltransferase [Gammaproteobacteria bacterium]|nr:MAG: [acyl-carrier-protein] S-malonyltransferase [Gammaproteobacteria bacterium]